MIVVSDTSPITYLFKIEQLHLLELLFQQVVIPEAVYNELIRVESQAKWLLHNPPDWILIKSVSDKQQVENLLTVLDKGESEAIVLATELNADILLIDEALGRTVAATKGLQVTGVIGVLLEAKAQKFIPAVKPLLDLLIQKRFRISDKVYRIILQQTNEPC